MNNDKQSRDYFQLSFIQTDNEDGPRDPVALVSGRFKVSLEDRAAFADELAALVEKYKIREVH